MGVTGYGPTINLSIDSKPTINLRTDSGPVATLTADAVNMTSTLATDYETLDNKPSIEGNVLIGDKRLNQLGITPDNMGLDELMEDVTPLSNLDIDSLFD